MDPSTRSTFRPSGLIITFGKPVGLYFRLFVNGLRPAPIAELFELYFTFNAFAIFSSEVVVALAFVALQFYEMVLGHNG